MFFSLGVRMLVNVEALNMVEAVGNLVRHRTVPYIYRSGTSYVIQWVPAISGESLAHAFQEYIVDVAKAQNYTKICYWCSRKEFIKHFHLKFIDLTKNRVSYSNVELTLAGKYAGKTEGFTWDDIAEIEKTITASCIVEDVTGFLVIQGPTKRTSRVYLSYIVPTLDSVKRGAVAVDNQFFVRHAPQAETFRQQTGRDEIPPAQAPYYVQVGSALYGFTVYVDLDWIGVSSVTGELVVGEEEAKQRRIIVLEALREMLDSRIFGAKLSRFTPVLDYEILVATISDKVKFTISPPQLDLDEFIKETIVRAVKASLDSNSNIKVYIWYKAEDVEAHVDEALKKVEEEVRGNYGRVIIERIKSSSVRDLFNKIISELRAS